MSTDKFDGIITELGNILLNLQMDSMEEKCKEPCTHVDINLERFFYRQNVPNQAYVSLQHDKKVKVYTKVHSYNGFRNQI